MWMKAKNLKNSIFFPEAMGHKFDELSEYAIEREEDFDQDTF